MVKPPSSLLVSDLLLFISHSPIPLYDVINFLNSHWQEVKFLFFVTGLNLESKVINLVTVKRITVHIKQTKSCWPEVSKFLPKIKKKTNDSEWNWNRTGYLNFLKGYLQVWTCYVDLSTFSGDNFTEGRTKLVTGPRKSYSNFSFLGMLSKGYMTGWGL